MSQKKGQIHEVLQFLSTNKENVVDVALVLFCCEMHFCC